MLRTPLSSDSMWDLLSCPTHSSCPKVAQATVSEMLPPGHPCFSPTPTWTKPRSPKPPPSAVQPSWGP